MARRSTKWLVMAVLFGAANVGGAVMAALAREPLHIGAHVALVLASAYAAIRIWSAQRGAAPRPLQVTADERPANDRLDHLELLVESLVLGVERMGEGQRFLTRVIGDRAPPPAAVARTALRHDVVDQAATRTTIE